MLRTPIGYGKIAIYLQTGLQKITCSLHHQSGRNVSQEEDKQCCIVNLPSTFHFDLHTVVPSVCNFHFLLKNTIPPQGYIQIS